ncbi:ornithine cyclodeaminase family protein [bacterium]|nr:ornithine cyclodeaminase family protein [bacterium]
MKVRIINQKEVEELLTMRECIGLMEKVLMSLAKGEAILPLRPVMWLPEKNGALALMPSYLANPASMGVKVISVFPANTTTEYDSHQGVILLFETVNGRLLAIVDATSVTAIRTAAASGAATKILAREDANDLAILGSGVQAKTHLEAMLVSRNIRSVRAWSPNPNHLRDFVQRESKRHGIEVKAANSAEETIRGADLICTATSAKEPIVDFDWLAPGAHINAIGACVPTTRELDSNTVVRSRLFVDRLESALNEAGDVLIPKKEGLIDENHIQGEIGEVLIGRKKGRSSRDEITIFKSLGIAVEDLASANFLYDKASSNNVGVAVEIGGSRSHGTT